MPDDGNAGEALGAIVLGIVGGLAALAFLDAIFGTTSCPVCQNRVRRGVTRCPNCQTLLRWQ